MMEKIHREFQPEDCFTKDSIIRHPSEGRDGTKHSGRSWATHDGVLLDALMKSGKVRPCIKPSERILKSIPFLAKSINTDTINLLSIPNFRFRNKFGMT